MIHSLGHTAASCSGTSPRSLTPGVATLTVTLSTSGHHSSASDVLVPWGKLRFRPSIAVTARARILCPDTPSRRGARLPGCPLWRRARAIRRSRQAGDLTARLTLSLASAIMPGGSSARRADDCPIITRFRVQIPGAGRHRLAARGAHHAGCCAGISDSIDSAITSAWSPSCTTNSAGGFTWLFPSRTIATRIVRAWRRRQRTFNRPSCRGRRPAAGRGTAPSPRRPRRGPSPGPPARSRAPIARSGARPGAESPPPRRHELA